MNRSHVNDSKQTEVLRKAHNSRRRTVHFNALILEVKVLKVGEVQLAYTESETEGKRKRVRTHEENPNPGIDLH